MKPGLNFSVAPLLAWLTRDRPPEPRAQPALALAVAAAVPWVADCFVMRTRTGNAWSGEFPFFVKFGQRILGL